MTRGGSLALRAAAAALVALSLGWIVGGQCALGRVDPALSLPLVALPTLILVWSRRSATRGERWRAIALSLLILLAAQTIVALAMSDGSPWLQLALVAVGWMLAATVADTLVQWRRGAALTFFMAALFVAGWFAAGHVLLAALYRPAIASGPPVTLLTGLPLRWSAGEDMAAMIAAGTNEDPVLARLRASGPVEIVDSLVDQPPASGGALLLAHPRALAPRELVAIDAFVRGGGRAVILADALTGWPVRHPIGDPRNPPVTSLLTPLLDHWGVTLAAAPAGEKERSVDVERARLRLFSAGRFERLPPACQAFAASRIARCPIGRGEVWLVGDADLLFAPLWQGDPVWANHLRRADTMEWLAARLWPDAPRALLRPLWARLPAE